MKITLVLAAAALGLITASAHAESEGNGEPFAYRVPGLVTVMTSPDATAVAGVKAPALASAEVAFAGPPRREARLRE